MKEIYKMKSVFALDSYSKTCKTKLIHVQFKTLNHSPNRPHSITIATPNKAELILPHSKQH